MVLRPLIVTLVACALAPSVWAHRLVLFATASGATVNGEAFFSGGIPAQGLTIDVVGPSGDSLGSAETDDGGRFTFESPYRCDLNFSTDAGDGHHAEYTLAADELSVTLPAYPSDGSESPTVAAPESEPVAESISNTELRRTIEEVVGDQIRPLREQIVEYENRVRFHEIVGGIGYIVGVIGLLALIRSRSGRGGTAK